MERTDPTDFGEASRAKASLSVDARQRFEQRSLSILQIGVLIALTAAVSWVLLVAVWGIPIQEVEAAKTYRTVWLLSVGSLLTLTLVAVGASYLHSHEITASLATRWHWVLSILLALTTASLFGAEFHLFDRWRPPEGYDPTYAVTERRAFALLDTYIIIVLISICTSARAVFCVILIGYGVMNIVMRAESPSSEGFYLFDWLDYLQPATLAIGGAILSRQWRVAEIGRILNEEVAQLARKANHQAKQKLQSAECANASAKADLVIAAQARADAEAAKEEIEEELEDIESQRREVAAQNRRLEKLFSAVTHDVRTPLSALSLQLSMMRGRPERTYTVAEIEGLLRITRRTSEIIEYAVNPDSDPVAVHRLTEIIEPHVRDLERSADQKRLDLEIEVAPVIVRTGRVRLAIVVQNFLQNAIRYSGEVPLGSRGKIIIRTKSLNEQRIRLEVVDEGPGIAQDDLNKIWERGTQLGNTNRDGTKGYGQGLAIVREAIQSLDSHNCGAVSVPNEGSVFWIEIPLATTGEEGTEYGVIKPTRLLERMRIAILEDHAENRVALATTLRDWNCEVFDGETPEEVLEKLRIESIKDTNFNYLIPHLLIVDYNLLDGLYGIDAIPMLRSAIKQNVPAAIWTADANENLRKTIKSAGLYYLPKSREALELAPILNRVSDEWRASTQKNQR